MIRMFWSLSLLHGYVRFIYTCAKLTIIVWSLQGMPTDANHGHRLTIQNMKPAYENVARAFASEPDCVVAHMNADEADNKPIASKYDVRSFPTIKFFPKGSKTPINYEVGRSEGQFVDVCPFFPCLILPLTGSS
jgi:hypothetical protein